MQRLLGILAGSALAVPVSASVLVVDPGGSGGYYFIQPAVNAAQDGDTILIKSGVWEEAVVVDGKGITIQADAGATVVIQGGLKIINLLPGQETIVAGLRVEGNTTNSFLIDTVGLLVDDNQGSVTARDCEFIGAPGTNDGFAGVVVESSAEVALIDCQAIGAAGKGLNSGNYEIPGDDGGVGIFARDSHVSLCGTVAIGGPGGAGGQVGGNGGHGIYVTGPLAAAQSVNGSYTGGNGGNAWDFQQVQTGDGGHGMHLGLLASFQSFGDLFTGGAAGIPLVFPCCKGIAGKPTHLSGGAVLETLGNYCVPGVSASGCSALISSTGTPSASAPSGFLLHTSGVEGSKDGQFYFGTNGKANNPWGNSSSTMCVAPPSKRGALLGGNGTAGACDGVFAYDLTQRWTQKPSQNPGAGSVVQAQFWFRDAFSTSNQVTCLSEAIEFPVCP